MQNPRDSLISEYKPAFNYFLYSLGLKPRPSLEATELKEQLKEKLIGLKENNSNEINAKIIIDYHSFILVKFEVLSQNANQTPTQQKENKEQILTLARTLEKDRKLENFLKIHHNNNGFEIALSDASSVTYPTDIIIGENAWRSLKTSIKNTNQESDSSEKPKVLSGYQLIKLKTLKNLYQQNQSSEFTKTLVNTLKFDETDLSNFLNLKENSSISFYSDTESQKKINRLLTLVELKTNLDSFDDKEEKSANYFDCFRKQNKKSPKSNLSDLIEKEIINDLKSLQIGFEENEFSKLYFDFITSRFDKITEQKAKEEISNLIKTVKEVGYDGIKIIKNKALGFLLTENQDLEFTKTLIRSLEFKEEDIADFLESRRIPFFNDGDYKIQFDKIYTLSKLGIKTEFDSNLHNLIEEKTKQEEKNITSEENFYQNYSNLVLSNFNEVVRKKSKEELSILVKTVKIFGPNGTKSIKNKALEFLLTENQDPDFAKTLIEKLEFKEDDIAHFLESIKIDKINNLKKHGTRLTGDAYEFVNAQENNTPTPIPNRYNVEHKFDETLTLIKLAINIEPESNLSNLIINKIKEEIETLKIIDHSDNRGNEIPAPRTPFNNNKGEFIKSYYDLIENKIELGSDKENLTTIVEKLDGELKFFDGKIDGLKIISPQVIRLSSNAQISADLVMDDVPPSERIAAIEISSTTQPQRLTFNLKEGQRVIL